MDSKKLSKQKEPNFFPDIDDYLRFAVNAATPARSNMKEMVAFVRARTGLSVSATKIIISAFFKEIIDLTVAGEKFRTNELGTFHTKKRAQLLFKSSKRLRKVLNAKKD